MTWAQFCLALSESAQVRNSWTQAQEIKGGAPQPFKVRASVDSQNQLGLEVEKKYLALTEAEFVEKFKIFRCISFCKFCSAVLSKPGF